jgi:hypothetical protein
MEIADAALRADIESDGPYSNARRIRLIDELQLAADEYVERISRLRGGAEDTPSNAESTLLNRKRKITLEN